jgi:hypothetical protein
MILDADAQEEYVADTRISIGLLSQKVCFLEMRCENTDKPFAPTHIDKAIQVAQTAAIELIKCT